MLQPNRHCHIIYEPGSYDDIATYPLNNEVIPCHASIHYSIIGRKDIIDISLVVTPQQEAFYRRVENNPSSLNDVPLTITRDDDKKTEFVKIHQIVEYEKCDYGEIHIRVWAYAIDNFQFMEAVTHEHFLTGL